MCPVFFFWAGVIFQLTRRCFGIAVEVHLKSEFFPFGSADRVDQSRGVLHQKLTGLERHCLPITQGFTQAGPSGLGWNWDKIVILLISGHNSKPSIPFRVSKNSVLKKVKRSALKELKVKESIKGSLSLMHLLATQKEDFWMTFNMCFFPRWI